MSCSMGDPLSCVPKIAQDSVAAIAHSFADGAAWSVKTMTTAWLHVPSPDVESSNSSATWLQGKLSYFVLAAAVASILYAAGRMATSGDFQHTGDLARSLARLLIVGGLAASVTTLCLSLGDSLSTWFLEEAQVDLAGSGLFNPTLWAQSSITPAVLVLLSLFVILVQIVQLLIMLVKGAMVVLLVGFLPLTAAATNTPTGKQGYQKAIAWLAAFVMYKPLAAAIYALSFKLSSGGTTITDQMSGIALMVLAVIALPALMRFTVPATAAVTGGNAGAVSGAVAGAALATGALIATGGGSAGAAGLSGGAGPSGSGGPTGGGGPAGDSGPTGGGGPTGADTTSRNGASGADYLNAAEGGANLGGNAGDSETVDKP